MEEERQPESGVCDHMVIFIVAGLRFPLNRKFNTLY
jgi:hypothetical protein